MKTLKNKNKSLKEFIKDKDQLNINLKNELNSKMNEMAQFHEKIVMMQSQM